MTRPKIFDQFGRPLRASSITSFPGGLGYDGAGAGRQQTTGWSTAPVPSVSETRERAPLAARARDLIRNSGIASGALRKARAQTIGPGLALRAKPDAHMLGVDPREALAFGREIERAWRAWANGPEHQCDIKRMRGFGRILRSLWSERFTTGECVAVLRWRPDRGTQFATCVQEIDPERMSNPQDKPDTADLSQGIELTPDGEPAAYHFRDAHQYDYRWNAKSWSWTRLPRIGEDGRRIVVHGFDIDRAEQIRGVTPFAPILVGFRDLQRFTEAEIGAAILNATFAAFVKAGMDPVAVSDALGIDFGEASALGQSWQAVRTSIYGEQGISIRDNRVPLLAPGDEVEMNNTTRQVGAFADFKKAFLQDFATALGLPYPVLAEDWEGVSYSAARAALAETWRIVTEDRTNFVADTVSPIHAEVITEAFWRGILVEPDGWPSFEGNEAGYLAGDWTGPGRGYVDPLKEAQANLLLRKSGGKTLDQICAEQGQDWETILHQLATEDAYMEELGITLPELADALAARPRSDMEQNS